jgi:hypothetical protein
MEESPEGEEITFENCSGALKKWYSISLQSAEKAISFPLIEDVTKRK